MALGNIANEETFILENLLKLIKNSESLWYLNQDLRRPSPTQLGETEMPFQSRAAKKIGLLLPPAPHQGVLTLGGRDSQLAFLACWHLLLLRPSNRDSLPRPVPADGMEALPCAGHC